MKLKQAMIEKGFSVKDLAREIGISYSYALRLHKGLNAPGKRKAEMLYDWLYPHTSLAELEHPKRF